MFSLWFHFRLFFEKFPIWMCVFLRTKLIFFITLRYPTSSRYFSIENPYRFQTKNDNRSYALIPLCFDLWMSSKNLPCASEWFVKPNQYSVSLRHVKLHGETFASMVRLFTFLENSTRWVRIIPCTQSILRISHACLIC